MRKRMTAAACVATLLWAVEAGAQAPPKPPPTMSSAIHQWWDMIARQFVGLADAMPEEKWSFQPKDGAFDGVRTFGEQVKHVACGNYGFFLEIEKKTPPVGCGTGGPHPAKTKAEVMQYLRESFEVRGHRVEADHAGERPRRRRRSLRWREHATGSDHAGHLARV